MEDWDGCIHVTVCSGFVEVKYDLGVVLHYLEPLLDRLMIKTEMFNHKEQRIEENIEVQYFYLGENYIRLPRFTYRAVRSILDNTPLIDRIKFNKGPEQLPGADIELNMVEWFKTRNDEQNKYIDFLTTHPGHIRILPAVMGAGKTVCTLAAICNIGKRAFFAMAPKYMEQWYGEFLKFTDISEEDILLVAGSGGLKALFEMDELPKVLICSINTLRNYIKDDSDFPVKREGFSDYINAGIKVADEAHEQLAFQVLLSLFFNTENNIALTATLTAEDSLTKMIEEYFYPIKDRCPITPPPKYISVIDYKYSFKGKIPVVTKRIPRFSGPVYSHIKLEKYIFKNINIRNNYFNMLFDILREEHPKHLYKNKFKTLIFFSSRDMVEAFIKFLSELAPDLNILSYYGGSNFNNKFEADILVGIPQKCGTGVDIPRLATVIQTVCISSIGANLQYLGRLRDLENLDESEVPTTKYICLYTNGISKHDDAAIKRRRSLGLLAKSFETKEVDESI